MSKSKHFILRVLVRGSEDFVRPLIDKRWKLLRYVVIAGVVAYIRYRVGGATALSGYAIVVVSGIGGSFAWALIELIWNIIVAPSRIIREQDDKLAKNAELIDKLNFTLSGGGINIEITPVTLREDQVASLRIFNRNKRVSVFCTPHPKKIFHLYTPEELTDITEIINEYNKEFSWDGGSDYPEVEIRPGKPKFINIARHLGNATLFTFFGPEKAYSLGKYKIYIEIDCRENQEENIYHTKRIIVCLDTRQQLVDGRRVSIHECAGDVVDWD